jgi:hypothetical protein
MAEVPSSRMVRLAALWCGVQALGIAAWWSALVLVPALREAFVVPGSSELTLFAFVVPDVLLGVVGGLVATVGLWRARPWGHTALLLVTGAMVYAALYCVVIACAGAGWWGAVLMTPSLIVMPLLCVSLGTGTRR